MILEYASVISFVFVAWFTARAYRGGSNPRAAIIEAWANILIGFSINFFANFLILPLVGAHVSVSNNFSIGWIYTAISMLRQYAIRRWFQDHLHATALRLAKDIS